MNIEVECKVRIENKDMVSLFHTIDAYMKGIEHTLVEKKDIYYSYKNENRTLFRIRRVGDEYIITRKVKEERSDGVEVNQEIEFTSPLQSSIVNFFESLGYTPIIKKVKQGYSWMKNNLTIELVEVSPLGWFIEIELLVNNSEQEIEKAIEQLTRIRKELGIKSLELETEYYNDLLKRIED